VIVSLTLVLVAQLLGEMVAHGSGLPVPGPVLGAALMFGFLLIRDRHHRAAERLLPGPLVHGELEGTAKGLLAHLALMFVPAGVGIVGRLDVLAANGLALAVVLLVSVMLTLSATALTFVAVSRLVRPHRPDEPA